jgi:hypothetical protein
LGSLWVLSCVHVIYFNPDNRAVLSKKNGL